MELEILKPARFDSVAGKVKGLLGQYSSNDLRGKDPEILGFLASQYARGRYCKELLLQARQAKINFQPGHMGIKGDFAQASYDQAANEVIFKINLDNIPSQFDSASQQARNLEIIRTFAVIGYQMTHKTTVKRVF